MNDANPLQEFMSVTAKSTVAVIVPLYGFWNDIQDNPVNGALLNAVLRRVYSNVHHLYIIFVANPQSLPNDLNDPESVANVIMSKTRAGNVKNIPVKRSATYAEYIRQGFDCAINDTNAQFMVVINPWILIQDGAIDVLVDRVNRADEAKMVSGYNIRNLISPEGFDSFNNVTPKEDWDISLNLMAVPRFAAEMMGFDPNIMTRPFLEMDMFQTIRGKGYAPIASERIPIFPFDFPWTAYETKEMFDADKAYFISKWKFEPGIEYGKQQ